MVVDSGKPSFWERMSVQSANQTWAGSSQFRTQGILYPYVILCRCQKALPYAILFALYSNSMNRFLLSSFYKRGNESPEACPRSPTKM